MTAALYAVVVGRKGDYPSALADSARDALVRFKDGENPLARKLSNIECGKLLGTSEATISTVVGENPKTRRQMQLPLALALTKKLGCTLDDLFFNRGYAKQERTPTVDEIAEAVVRKQDERKGSRITTVKAKAR